MRMIICLVALAGCGKNKCDVCTDDDLREVCEDTIDLCNLTGPAGLIFRKDCIESAVSACEDGAVDSGDGGATGG